MEMTKYRKMLRLKLTYKSLFHSNISVNFGDQSIEVELVLIEDHNNITGVNFLS